MMRSRTLHNDDDDALRVSRRVDEDYVCDVSVSFTIANMMELNGAHVNERRM